MMRNLFRSLTVLALVGAATAGAVKKGDPLFIKSKDTKVLKDPKADSKTVDTLQPGTSVTWNGPSDKDKQFHEVTTAKGKKGYVLMSNLTPNKPADEISGSSGEPVSAHAFASSGAATKALTEAGVSYAKGKGASTMEAAAEIIYVEEFNKTKGTNEAIAAKAKELAGGK
jgi:predicted small lipoprotein YifL